MSAEIIQIVNLDQPGPARQFLKDVRIGYPPGSKITFLVDAKGREIPIDQASDEQVIQVAAEIASAIHDGRKK